MTTRVVHVDDNVEGAVYIGRASPRKGLRASEWRNPFKIGAPSHQGGVSTRDRMTREQVIARYEEYLRKLLFDPSIPHMNRIWMDGLRELAGKPLACYCRHDGEPVTPETRCHGDVIVALIDELGLEPKEA